jgi:hypothetical protein
MQTIVFHVSIPGTGRVWRKIELRENQTLEQLHLAIQDAFKFDDDHLYSFFMSGKAWDGSSEYALPEASEPFFMPPSPAELRTTLVEQMKALLDLPEKKMEQKIQADTGITPEKIQQALDILIQEMAADLTKTITQEAQGGDVQTTKLSDLRLTVKQEFLYLFDYGDEWRFQVRVHAINPKADKGKYPRIVEEVGDPPPQYEYPDWDDEDEWDEDSGFDE